MKWLQLCDNLNVGGYFESPVEMETWTLVPTCYGFGTWDLAKSIRHLAWELRREIRFADTQLTRDLICMLCNKQVWKFNSSGRLTARLN